MTDKATLLALAERVEALDGPDRNLDADIMRATGLAGLKADYAPHPYSTSLDAAMTLVPEGWEWSLEAEETEMFFPVAQAWTYRCQMGHLIDREAATPALALCAAALRARAETQP